MQYKCISCNNTNIDKNTIGINKKLLDEKTKKFYCLECLAIYLNCTVEDLLEKIEEFKTEGCKLFN